MRCWSLWVGGWVGYLPLEVALDVGVQVQDEEFMGRRREREGGLGGGWDGWIGWVGGGVTYLLRYRWTWG